MFKKTLLRKKCLVIFNELKICNFNTNIGIYKKNFRIIEGDYFRIILTPKVFNYWHVCSNY